MRNLVLAGMVTIAVLLTTSCAPPADESLKAPEVTPVDQTGSAAGGPSSGGTEPAATGKDDVPTPLAGNVPGNEKAAGE